MSYNSEEIIALIKTKKELLLDKGLTDVEIKNIELKYKFKFPPDLVDLFKRGVPIGREWINWRKPNISVVEPYDPIINKIYPAPQYADDVEKKIYHLFGGILKDIVQNNFWIEDFGVKPSTQEEALKQALTFLQSDAVPRMIPLFAHRFMPAEPNEAGNPVFSCMETDVIVYGSELLHYVFNEVTDYTPCRRKPKDIVFWGKLAGDTYVLEDTGEDDEIFDDEDAASDTTSSSSSGEREGEGSDGLEERLLKAMLVSGLAAKK